MSDRLEPGLVDLRQEDYDAADRARYGARIIEIPEDLWYDIRRVVLDAPCRHVDELNWLACDDCIRIRQVVAALL